MEGLKEPNKIEAALTKAKSTRMGWYRSVLERVRLGKEAGAAVEAVFDAYEEQKDESEIEKLKAEMLETETAYREARAKSDRAVQEMVAAADQLFDTLDLDEETSNAILRFIGGEVEREFAAEIADDPEAAELVKHLLKPTDSV